MRSKSTVKTVIITVIVIAAIVLAAVATVFVASLASEADKISLEAAESILNEQFDSLAGTKPTQLIAEKNSIRAESLEYGNEKDISVKCTIETPDVHSVLEPLYDKYLSSDEKKPGSSMFKSKLDFKLEFEDSICAVIGEAPMKTVECTLCIYQLKDGLTVYFSDEAIDAVYGGVKTAENEINAKESFTDESGNEVKIVSANVNKGLADCIMPRYTPDKPDTANVIIKAWNSFKEDFDKNFIQYDRWKTILTGLWITIKLTLFALLIGIVIGFLVAFVRATYIKNENCSFVIKILDKICGAYLGLIRGTPVVVQIMIIYFVIFMPLGVDKFIAAVICFGLNSGAYVAEIVRGGIMSVDDGQMEAGRSLGFGYMQTMSLIVFPQAFKNVLPALANEFVVLLKETSIAFYIGLGDLMYSVNAIRAATYTPFLPLIAAAVIYLVMVVVLSKLVSLLERRLQKK